MSTGFLITARLKSTRLPRKLMMPLGKTTLVGQVIERAKRLDGLDRIVLCTSPDSEDNPLVLEAKRYGISVFRGDPVDVLKRLSDACSVYGFSRFVGITGENPLFSLEYAQAAIDRLKNEDDHYVTIAGLPIGMAVYGADARVLKFVSEIKQEVDTEIWGYLFLQPSIFRVHEITVDADNVWTDLRLTTDYPEDYAFIQAVFRNIPEETRLSTNALLMSLKESPELTQIHAHRKQEGLPEEAIRRINRFYHDNADEIRRRLKTVLDQ